MNEFCNVGAALGQGTLGGAIISQAVLDDGVQEHFPPGGNPAGGNSAGGNPAGGNMQLQYGSVPLARISNEKVDLLTKQSL